MNTFLATLFLAAALGVQPKDPTPPAGMITTKEAANRIEALIHRVVGSAGGGGAASDAEFRDPYGWDVFIESIKDKDTLTYMIVDEAIESMSHTAGANFRSAHLDALSDYRRDRIQKAMSAAGGFVPEAEVKYFEAAVGEVEANERAIKAVLQESYGRMRARVPLVKEYNELDKRNDPNETIEQGDARRQRMRDIKRTIREADEADNDLVKRLAQLSQVRVFKSDPGAPGKVIRMRLLISGPTGLHETPRAIADVPMVVELVTDSIAGPSEQPVRLTPAGSEPVELTAVRTPDDPRLYRTRPFMAVSTGPVVPNAGIPKKPGGASGALGGN